MKYIPTIGLEIHTELKTDSKMFCDCKNDPLEKRPNFNICPICLGHPGTLPVANEEAIKKTLKVCLALNCKICPQPQFYRKNYFYPDLPKGFQITSQPAPFGIRGYLDIADFNWRSSSLQAEPARPEGYCSRVSIHHIHLEEDTARLLHPGGADYSLIDFNRAGVPLMELVTNPDIYSGVAARQFCQKLQLIFRYLDVSDADMEKGQMRCEVNISIIKNSKLKTQHLGTKVEIKNLNSFRAVERAIDYESKRQAEVLDSGEKVIQETRGWDENKQMTVSQRTKEEAHDYRYFPEPDLPPLNTKSRDTLQCVSTKDLPELPQARQARFQQEYSLPKKQAEIFINNPDLADYFEKVVSELKEWMNVGIENVSSRNRASPCSYKKAIKLTANYLITELQKLLTLHKKTMADLKITPENFAEFIAIICQDKVSSSGAQTLLAEMFKTGADPSSIIEAKNLAQISDSSVLEKAVIKVIKNNPNPAADFKGGKQNALQFLVGQVMKETRGQANPKMVLEILKKRLS